MLNKNGLKDVKCEQTLKHTTEHTNIYTHIYTDTQTNTQTHTHTEWSVACRGAVQIHVDRFTSTTSALYCNTVCHLHIFTSAKNIDSFTDSSQCSTSSISPHVSPSAFFPDSQPPYGTNLRQNTKQCSLCVD